MKKILCPTCAQKMDIVIHTEQGSKMAPYYNGEAICWQCDSWLVTEDPLPSRQAVHDTLRALAMLEGLRR